MDSLQMKKIKAINKYRKQRLLNKLMLYSFTSLTCILFLSSPLWYSLLGSFLNSLLFESIPKIGALFFSSKCIFLVGNLIVIFLVGEAKMFKSPKSPSNVLKQNYVAEKENDQKSFIFPADEAKISRSRYPYSLPLSVNLKYGEQEKGFCVYNDDDEEEEQKESVILENVMHGIKGNYCTKNCKENEQLEKFKELKFAAAAVPNELSKRADDFIARVNKQIRLEAVGINDLGQS